MSHPSREQWTEYVYGEHDPAGRADMEEHLRSCKECRVTLSSWRAVMGELDRWEVHEPARRPGFLRRALPWAAAAALMLAVGYGLGRLSPATPVDRAALKAELEPFIRQAAQEMEARWQASLTAAQDQVRREILDQVRREMNNTALATLEAAESTTSDLLGQYAQSLDSARRSDLLAVASLSERELWRTKWQLASMLAYALPAPPVSETSDVSRPNP